MFSLFLLRASSFKICPTSFVLGGKNIRSYSKWLLRIILLLDLAEHTCLILFFFGFYVVGLWGSEVNSLCFLWRRLNIKQRQRGLLDLWYVHYIVFILYRETVVLASSGRHIRTVVCGLGHSGCICQYFNQSKIFIT